MITKITNGRLLMDGGIQTGLNLYYEDGVILTVTAEDLPYDTLLDAEGQYVSPGFIDLHLHGGGGADVMDGGVEPIRQAANFHLRHGATSQMPTSMACSPAVLHTFLQDIRRVMQEKLTEATILGAHLEGPYFAPAQAGAQNPQYITPPDPAAYRPLLAEFGDVIRRWDFAPELPGSDQFCRDLLASGVLPAIAHSDATLEDIRPVYEQGCHLVTHLYSGMSGLTRVGGYRRLGVVESTFLLEDMQAEIIADGHHLPAELLQLIIKQKGLHRLCAVTDAMRGAGMPEGPSFIGRKGEETPCILEGGVARSTDRTGFCGSVATADRLLRVLVQEAGLPVESAVLLLTENPAALFGLTHKGRLMPGWDADIVIFDEHIHLSAVIAGGKTVV